TQVDAPDRCLRPAQARDGPEDQLLVQLRGAAVDRAADQVGVALLELTWAEDTTPADPRAEAGGEPFEARLHPVGEPLAVVAVPAAGDAAVAGVAHRLLRHVRVSPHRLGAGRRAAGVTGGHLPGDQERQVRHRTGADLGVAARELL